MTLLLALANQSHSVLLADRRITGNGLTLDDEQNKLCVLFCHDAKLAVAFTGLAKIGSFDTATWIAETLFEISGTKPEIAPLLEEFQRRATTTFTKLPEIDRRVTIIFSGYVYWSDSPESRVYVLSNFENSEQSLTSFSLRTIDANGGAIVELAGMIDAVPSSTITALESLVRKAEVPIQSLVRFAVTHLQYAAKNVRSLRLIGEQCNSAAMSAAPDTVVTSTYHSRRNSNRAYGANVVIAGSSIYLGVELELKGSGILAGPDIRKNDPCWCGSGTLFKHCHLKKFGAIYAQSTMFQRPLPMIIKSSSDIVRPTGKFYCVASSFA